MRDRSYKVTYSFLAVCTYEVPLYLCSIFSGQLNLVLVKYFVS